MHDGGCQLRQRARILQHGQRQILHLSVVVRDVRHHTRHGLRKTHHPAQHVNMVDGVVQRAAAALLLPCAAPPQVVVAVPAPPGRCDGCAQHFARKPAVQQFLQVADGLAEAVLGDNREFLAAFIAGAEHFVAFFQRCRHRLFADDVLARTQAVDGNAGVDVRRRADIHQVNILA